MGVDGFNLLKLSTREKHQGHHFDGSLLEPGEALSILQGRSGFMPKDEIARIATFVNDVLEAEERKKIPGGDGLSG
jgi:hypothetical protein